MREMWKEIKALEIKKENEHNFSKAHNQLIDERTRMKKNFKWNEEKRATTT